MSVLRVDLDDGVGAAALVWLEALLEEVDTTRLSRFTVDHGKMSRPIRGVWGVCRGPHPLVTEGVRSTYRISCHVGRDWPFGLRTRKAPLHKNPDGWIKRYATTTLIDADEAIVWIASHELFHFLAATRQVRHNNTEIRADGFADAELAKFRGQPKQT